MKYQSMIEEILYGIGGNGNIKELNHCVTRLRFILKDDEKANIDRLKKIKGVITVIKSGGQIQVVVGNQASEIYKKIIINKYENNYVNQDLRENKTNLLNKFIDIVSSVFTPLLGILAATGMLKGLNAMFVAFGWLEINSGTYKILQASGDSMMYFFPIFLGYTSAKKFKLPPFIGMVIGAALVHPIMTGIINLNTEPLYTLFEGSWIESPVYITFLGMPVILMNYGSSILPIIIATYFASKVYKRADKVVPISIKSFLVPLITIVVIIPLTFLIIGPISTLIGNLLGAITLALYNLNPMIAGVIIGGGWQVLVVFGLHWGIIPIGINNLVVRGSDPILALAASTSFATAGVVLGILLKTTNKELKTLAIPSFISSVFGVSEPSIYGITLPRKKPFYITLLASSVGGLIIGGAGSKAFQVGGMGIFGIPNYINPENGLDKGFYGYLIAIITAFLIGFFLSFTIGYKNGKDDVENYHKEIT